MTLRIIKDKHDGMENNLYGNMYTNNDHIVKREDNFLIYLRTVIENTGTFLGNLMLILKIKIYYIFRKYIENQIIHAEC